MSNKNRVAKKVQDRAKRRKARKLPVAPTPGKSPAEERAATIAEEAAEAAAQVEEVVVSSDEVGSVEDVLGSSITE